VGQSNINFNHNSPLDLEQGPQRIEDKGGRHGLSPTSYPDVDPECVCVREGQRGSDEQEKLVHIFEQQDREATFLTDVLGLDFAALDEQINSFEPIWVKRLGTEMVPVTPSKQKALHTPPTTKIKIVHMRSD
jgi:hypothetical protein